ncbi:MAG: STAS domain-containing protein [Spirochaeta sp.]
MAVEIFEETHRGDVVTVVKLSGSLGIQQIGELHRALIPVLRGKNICIDTRGVQEADFALVQLLVAARKSAGEKGLTLDTSRRLGDAVREAAELAGYGHRITSNAKSG